MPTLTEMMQSIYEIRAETIYRRSQLTKTDGMRAVLKEVITNLQSAHDLLEAYKNISSED